VPKGFKVHIIQHPLTLTPLEDFKEKLPKPRGEKPGEGTHKGDPFFKSGIQ